MPVKKDTKRPRFADGPRLCVFIPYADAILFVSLLISYNYDIDCAIHGIKLNMHQGN